MLGIRAIRVCPPEHGKVVVIDCLAAAAQQGVAQGLVWVLLQFGLQVFGEGSPNRGPVEFCHPVEGRGELAICI